MKLRIQNQKGAATLLTAVILLISITLVTLLTAKTVLVETQMAADNYRTTQAVAAANAGMDFAVQYFDQGGFDHDRNGVVDYNQALDHTTYDRTYTSSDGTQTTYANINFDNSVGNRCVPSGSATMKHGLITVRGFSDDALGQRTISQCVGPLNVLRDDGPKQPLVAQGNVALTGNARIINRYTNTTIWSGDKVTIGSSSAMETYIKDPAVTSTLSLTQLLDTDDENNAILVSNRNLGNGLDIIDSDPSLGNLQGLEFFKNFFIADSRAELKALAGSQSYTSMTDAISTPVKSGLIWVEEADHDMSMTGGTIGSIDSPAIVVINGDFTLGGGATIYGLLYVTGKYTINGTPTVVGANVVEGTNLATETPATPPIVTGTGTISLVYWAGFATGSTHPLPGLTAVVAGSWRDW